MVTSNEDSECHAHELLKVALLVPLGDTVSTLMVEPPTQMRTDAFDAPSNLIPNPSRSSVCMTLNFTAPFSRTNRDSECQTGKLIANCAPAALLVAEKWYRATRPLEEM